LGEGPPGKPSECCRLLETLSPQVHRGGVSASTSTRAGWRAPQPGSPRTAVVPPPSPSLPSFKKFSALPDLCDGLSTFRGQLRYLQVRRAKFLKPAMSLTGPRLFWPPKLSGAGPGQYSGGGPPGEPSRTNKASEWTSRKRKRREEEEGGGGGGKNNCLSTFRAQLRYLQERRVKPLKPAMSLTAIPCRMHRISSDLRS